MTWGAIRWQAAAPQGTRIEISTRSGNTRTPDETWSDWTTPYPAQDGSPVSSPRARYLQWRAVLTGGRGEAPLLTTVTAAYLPRNIRPQVVSITINPPGTVFQRPFPTGDPEIVTRGKEFDQARQVAAEERLAAGDPHTVDAKRREGVGEECDLFEVEDALARKPGVVRFRHAVLAPQVAAIGDRNAQTAQRPVEPVQRRRRHAAIIAGLAGSGGRSQPGGGVRVARRSRKTTLTAVRDALQLLDQGTGRERSRHVG